MGRLYKKAKARVDLLNRIANMREKYRSIYQAIYIYYEIITHAIGICVRGGSLCVCNTCSARDKCSQVYSWAEYIECRIGAGMLHYTLCGVRVQPTYI